MTVETNAGFDANAEASAYGALLLVELAFASGTMRLTTWPVDVVALAQTWTGIGNLGGMAELRESEDGAGEKLTLMLSPVNESLLALALGNVNEYQGREVQVWLMLVDAAQPDTAQTPVKRFAGHMDMVRIERDPESGAGTIKLDCVTAAHDSRSNPSGLRISHQQHLQEHPGELGLAYVVDLAGKPSPWLTVKFQRQP